MVRGVKSIIFDLGGVMIDLDFDRCIESFKAIGFEGAEKLVSCYHPEGIFGAAERGEVTPAQLCDYVREVSGCGDLSDEAICEAYRSLLVGIPCSKLRMLERLREEGYKLYALSNINEIMYPRILEFFAADGRSADYYFDKMYLSYEMGVMKPSREIYERVISDSGVTPSETLFIDDGDKNIAAAREFGLRVYLAKAHEDFDKKLQKRQNRVKKR